jgi:hypothetical protein
MSTAHTRTIAALALVLAAFSGRLLDKTTGQPLPKVHVHAVGPVSVDATSDSTGRFTLKALRPGLYAIHVQSDDVPQQTFMVRLVPNRTTVLTMKVCSTTLDYDCGTPGGGGG